MYMPYIRAKPLAEAYLSSRMVYLFRNVRYWEIVSPRTPPPHSVYVYPNVDNVNIPCHLVILSPSCFKSHNIILDHESTCILHTYTCQCLSCLNWIYMGIKMTYTNQKHLISISATGRRVFAKGRCMFCTINKKYYLSPGVDIILAHGVLVYVIILFYAWLVIQKSIHACRRVPKYDIWK